MGSDSLQTETDSPKVQLKPLTLDQWAEHFKVDVARLKSAMKQAMRKIFDGDKTIIQEKENDLDAVEKRKGILRKQHRIGGKGIEDTVVLSVAFQSKLLNILAEKKYKRSEYYLISDIKGKKSFMNQSELNKAWRVIRMKHPEWFCKTGTNSGLRDTWGVIKVYEKEFLGELEEFETNLCQSRGVDKGVGSTSGLAGWGSTELVESGIYMGNIGSGREYE